MSMCTLAFEVVPSSSGGPPFTHPWLDNNNRVTTLCYSLQQWTRTSSLENVVRDILATVSVLNVKYFYIPCQSLLYNADNDTNILLFNCIVSTAACSLFTPYYSAPSEANQTRPARLLLYYTWQFTNSTTLIRAIPTTYQSSYTIY